MKSEMASFSQVSVKHRAAEFEKSLFIRERRRSLSVSLGRERSARWILGNGIRNLSELHKHVGSLPLSAHPAFDQRHRSANYNVQQKKKKTLK